MEQPTEGVVGGGDGGSALSCRRGGEGVFGGAGAEEAGAARGGDLFGYWGGAVQDDRLIEALDARYRRDLVRISRMIHAKASPGVRDFADAFRFAKDKD